MNMYCQKYEEQRNDIPEFLIKSENLLFSYFAKWKCTARWYKASFFWKYSKRKLEHFYLGSLGTILPRGRGINEQCRQTYFQHICKYIWNVYADIFWTYANILSTSMQIYFQHIYANLNIWTVKIAFAGMCVWVSNTCWPSSKTTLKVSHAPFTAWVH